MSMLQNFWFGMGSRILLGSAMVGAMLFGSAGLNSAKADEPAAPAAATAAPKKLTNEELKTIVENLGYEPEADMKDGKINLLILQFKQGTFQFVLYVSVSNDGNDIIVQAPLKNLPEKEDAYGKELVAMMAKGFSMTPSHFVVDDSRKLRLLRFVPNQDLTPAKVRKSIGDFTDQVRTTEDLWRCDRWEAKSASPTVVAKPVIPQLEGVWKIAGISAAGVAQTKEMLDARKLQMTIGGDKLNFSENGAAAAPITIRLGEGAGTLDFVHAADRIEKGLFSRDGNKAKLAFAAPGGERPTDYSPKSGVTVVELELAAQ